jgi:hypothetical protein
MTPAWVLIWGAAGALAGALHFLLLRRNVELWLGRGSIPAAVALHLARQALTLLVLVFAALHGWPALLGAAAGILCGRVVALRAAGGARP